MPVPAFNLHGIIPPYLGQNPGGAQNLMSPFLATSLEVARALGTNVTRLQILSRWLEHREELRALGVTGFQWIDGSFVEAKDQPGDMDIVTFAMLPPAVLNAAPAGVANLVQANLHLFDRAQAKARFSLDAFFVELYADAASIVRLTRYYLGLFSHRRQDNMWKGMIEVQLLDTTEAQARDWVNAALLAQAGAAPP